MRIISGKYKGLELTSFVGPHIRPTTDRVKESLFNILQSKIEEALVLDLFSGTGSLGIEAISRGAQQVSFVEKSRKSIEILEKNINQLKIIEPLIILKKDAIKFLKTYNGIPFDLILIDPPFTEKMADEVMGVLSLSRSFHEQTVIAIESERREKLDQQYKQLFLFDQRFFGDKVLSFFKCKQEGLKAELHQGDRCDPQDGEQRSDPQDDLGERN